MKKLALLLALCLLVQCIGLTTALGEEEVIIPAEEAAAVEEAVLAEEAVPSVEAASAEEPAPVEEAAPAEEAALVEEAAPAEGTVSETEEPASEEGSIGEAATTLAVPEGYEGDAAEVLGSAAEWEPIADVLSGQAGSTLFEVDAAGNLKQYNGSITDTYVRIPEVVDYNGTGVIVTGIERSAFNGNTYVTDIIIPTTVTWIDVQAFAGCTALQHIDLPNGISVISTGAFEGCTSLKGVSWSDSVSIIQDRAFYGCTALETLGNSSQMLTQIGDYAFFDCSSLRAVTWSSNLNTIGKYSFYNCSSLQALSLPLSVQVVNDYAFANCTGIKEIEFPGANLQRINTGAFKNCASLKEILIPDSVALIGNSAFEGCTSATNLSLPTGVMPFIIQDSAFRGCTSLPFISIPNNVTEIHQYAFYGCSSVNYVYTIPRSVEFIGNYAFDGLKNDCCIVVEYDPNNMPPPASPLVISKGALGTRAITNVFGVRGSVTQTYCDGYPGVNFYDIRIIQYVQRCYNIIMGRAGDPPGIIYWSRLLAQKKKAGGDIVRDFMFSKEFTDRVTAWTNAFIAGGMTRIQASQAVNQQVVNTILYPAMMGRVPDAAGSAYWTGFLNNGCSYDYLISGFCTSPEFKGICNDYGILPGTIPRVQNRDKNVNVTAFANRCYTIIQDRPGEPDGLNYWTGLLLNKKVNGGQMVANFIASDEFRGRGLTSAQQVTVVYQTMLNRAPDATGLAYWQTLLAQNMTAEAVVKGFSESIEFNFLCEGYGIKASPVNPSQYRDWNIAVTQFMNRMYLQALNRASDVDSLNTYTKQIITKKLTPADAAKRMYTCLECQLQGWNNSQFVTRVYRGMLNRSPSGTELADGVTKLTTGMTREAFVVEIGKTQEFKNIVSGFGL